MGREANFIIKRTVPHGVGELSEILLLSAVRRYGGVMNVSDDFDPNRAAGFFLCLPKVKEKNALVT